MVQAAREATQASGQNTLSCPLCGMLVNTQALTCPRCKSRMDAHPATIGVLADSFDKDGVFLGSGEACSTGKLSLPTTTAPFPPVESNTQPDPIGTETHTMDLSGFDVVLAPASTAIQSREPRQALSPKPKRNSTHIAAAIAAATFAIAVFAGGAFMVAQANTINEISDQRAEQDIRADSQFAMGSASEAFVDSSPYEVTHVRIGSKELVENGVDVNAVVMMGNEFFDESREVVVHYRKTDASAQETDTPAEDGWVHECTTISHSVQPKRGISNDPDHGIEGAVAELVGSSACHVSIPFEGPVTGSWFATLHGMRVIGYTFSNDTWERTSIDDSQLVTSYQNLVGTYRGNTQERDARFTSFVITQVDDATGTFSGTFACIGAKGLFGDTLQAQGSFSGTIGMNGSLEAAAGELPESASFTGKATGTGMLHLDVVAYGTDSSWLSSKPKAITFATTLEKVSDDTYTQLVESPDEATVPENERGSETEDLPEQGSDFWGWLNEEQPYPNTGEDSDGPRQDDDPPTNSDNWWRFWFG